MVWCGVAWCGMVWHGAAITTDRAVGRMLVLQTAGWSVSWLDRLLLRQRFGLLAGWLAGWPSGDWAVDSLTVL